jgi:hypothetical protein
VTESKTTCILIGTWKLEWNILEFFLLLGGAEELFAQMLAQLLLALGARLQLLLLLGELGVRARVCDLIEDKR